MWDTFPVSEFITQLFYFYLFDWSFISPIWGIHVHEISNAKACTYSNKKYNLLTKDIEE